MKYIICFYWQGERWQETGKDNKIPDDPSFKNHLRRVGTVDKGLVARYVNNLYKGAQKWSNEPFKFICFTNEVLPVDKAIECRPIKMITNRGVLPRMYMFSEDAGLFGSQVLCIDLDVVITGSLTDIMKYDGTFCTRPRWMHGQHHIPDGDIMSFKAGTNTQRIFWDPMVEDIDMIVQQTQGRERFWVEQAIGFGADLFSDICPGQIVGYKDHVRNKKFPKQARIVSCHGFPRPHQIKEEKWLTDNWQ